jgi:spore coat polysaccharide biosynthesis protein SpsF
MITAIIQARVNSSRLPNKIFADINGKPLIWHVVNRLKFSKKINNIVLATSLNKLDDSLEKWSQENNIGLFRGSENNVLERFYFASKKQPTEVVVRITADDPFKDPQIIDEVIGLLEKNNLDFAYNNNPPSFPEGLDTEVFTIQALEKAYLNSKDEFEQEHVTQYFYRNSGLFKQMNLQYHENISSLRWTIDREEDLTMTRLVYKNLFKDAEIFNMSDILELLKRDPSIAKINAEVERSTMYK